jgi:hypothetical protein
MFRTAAEPVFYNRVRISSDRQLSSFLQTVLSRKDLANVVRTVDIRMFLELFALAGRKLPLIYSLKWTALRNCTEVTILFGFSDEENPALAYEMVEMVALGFSTHCPQLCRMRIAPLLPELIAKHGGTRDVVIDRGSTPCELHLELRRINIKYAFENDSRLFLLPGLTTLTISMPSKAWLLDSHHISQTNIAFFDIRALNLQWGRWDFQTGFLNSIDMLFPSLQQLACPLAQDWDLSACEFSELRHLTLFIGSLGQDDDLHLDIDMDIAALGCIKDVFGAHTFPKLNQLTFFGIGNEVHASRPVAKLVHEVGIGTACSKREIRLKVHGYGELAPHTWWLTYDGRRMDAD